MTLRDTITSDALTVFCNPSEFAEQVTYYPRGGGESRTIEAVVFRESIEPYAEDEVTSLDVFQIHVANDAVDGISSNEIDTGGDAIDVAPRDGKSVVRKRITRILTQDQGMLVLEVR